MLLLAVALLTVGCNNYETYSDKKKQETAFYKRYIDKWMAEDQAHFLGVIRNKMSPHFRSKILKKLTGSSK